ncbi:MAG TPA: hypothetical protein VLX59_10730 [Acidimicrobiales bacterium]|nr:hypothetical protein [Acidimicrobiales bacterium]
MSYREGEHQKPAGQGRQGSQVGDGPAVAVPYGGHESPDQEVIESSLGLGVDIGCRHADVEHHQLDDHGAGDPHQTEALQPARIPGADENENQRPQQIQLLFDPQAPGLSQTERKGYSERRPPVAQAGADERVGTDGPEETATDGPPIDDLDGEEHVQRREDPGQPAHVEAAVTLLATKQDVGHQEATEDEEEVDAQEASGQHVRVQGGDQEGPDVEEEHAQHGYAAQAVEADQPGARARVQNYPSGVGRVASNRAQCCVLTLSFRIPDDERRGA